MSQGEFVVVKEEKASMNINILGISALKWTRKGEFKSDDHNILYCGQECLRRNRVALIVKKKKTQCEMHYLGVTSKNTE